MQQRSARPGRFLITSLMAIAMGIILSNTLSAQNTEEFDFDDIPVDDAGQYYVAIGGGYMGMVPFMKFDELNALSGSLGLGTFDGPLLLNGGGGLASILVVPNVRLGVFGVGGSRLVEATVATNNVNYKRSLRYGTSVTAAQIDYAIRLVGSLTVLPGVMVGAGTRSLEFTQTRIDSAGFGGIFTPTPGPDANHYARITNSYFFYYPAVNLEYAFTKFMMFRAGVGYAGSAWAGKWVDGAGAEIKGVPAIKSDGMTVQFGLFVGLFQNM
jgi:hypothetical protein